MNDAILVDELPPYCFKIDVRFDKDVLLQEFYDFFPKIGYTYQEFIEKGMKESVTFTEAHLPTAWTINLSYLPGLVGSDRWEKYRGTVNIIKDQGVSPVNFSKLLEELDGTHLKEVIDNLKKHHEEKYQRPFQGQVSIIWIAPKKGYSMHIDDTICGIKYHVPLVTNEDAMWIFKDSTNTFYTMHMPCDGTTWEFWPRSIEHTVINNGDVPRAHLILAELFDV